MTKASKSNSKTPSKRSADGSGLSAAELGAVTGGATTTGKVSLSEFTIKKSTDKTTP